MNVLFGGKLLYHPELKVERPRSVDHEVYLVEEDRTIWVNNFHKRCYSDRWAGILF